MSDTEYTYAVARIRAKEVNLFSAATIEQLIARPDYQSCLMFLQEKGWGSADTPKDAQSILAKEQEKTWADVRELIKDMSVFEMLDYPNAFHNLKAAIKEVCTGAIGVNIYYKNTNPSAEDILKAVQEKNFSSLPKYMAPAAQEAMETLLHTKDGQLCDIIIDKATLDAIHAAGKKTKVQVLKDYAESTVAVADIKIAERCRKTGKSYDFMMRALAPCDSLSVDALAHAAAGGPEPFHAYLKTVGYTGASDALEVSQSEFERWCDNRVIEALKPQKYNAFSIGPVVAYALARENEIKTVRIVLSGKHAGLPDDSIRERVREMYV